MLAVMDPTYFGVRSFVGLSFVALPLLLWLLRTSVALRTIVGPSRDVSLVRIELRNRWEVMGVVLSL